MSITEDSSSASSSPQPNLSNAPIARLCCRPLSLCLQEQNGVRHNQPCLMRGWPISVALALLTLSLALSLSPRLSLSTFRNKLGRNGSTAKPLGQLSVASVLRLPCYTHNAEEKYQHMHTPAHEGPRLSWGLGGISLAPACTRQMSLSNSDNRPEMSLASLSPAHLSTTRRHLP